MRRIVELETEQGDHQLAEVTHMYDVEGRETQAIIEAEACVLRMRDGTVTHAPFDSRVIFSVH